VGGLTLSEVTQALNGLAKCAVGDGHEARIFALTLDFALAASGFEKGVALASGLEQRPTVVANRGVDEAYVRFLADNYVRLPGIKTLEKVEPLVVLDVEVDPAYAAALTHLTAARIRSLSVFPARALDQEIFGSIAIYHSEPKTLDRETVDAIQVVVNHAAVTAAALRLHRARAYLLQQTLLEKSQNVISALAAGIAHDFNNLLGGMLGLVTLAPGLNQGELQSLCHRLADDVKHAAELTRNLLDLARDTQQVDGQERATEVGEALRQAVTMVRPTVPATVTIRVEPLDQLAWVRIGPTALSRVLLNLLINAVQAMTAMKDGGIVLRASVADGLCAIEVDDNGPGVPVDQTEQIFEPFVSVGKVGGSGVGLAAARGILERVGGSLTLKHREGPGACFVARLTIASPEVLAAPVEATEPPRHTASSNRLLVAEDEPIQRQVFVLALTRAGFQVDEVDDGEAARIALERGGYAAALLDHAMPGMTGASVLAAVRSKNLRLPIILVTGFGLDPQLVLMAADSHTRILPKPIDGDAVVRAVRDILAS
jgi:signal transduction histidine kinase/CheY-like chemotaxis protein